MFIHLEVVQPCLEIRRDVNKFMNSQEAGNMCLVVTFGSVVLGLKNIGTVAGNAG